MKGGVIMRKEILIMTKSAKINGFCVAGIDIHNGKWIRLVSDNNEEGEGAVLRKDLLYKDYSEAQIFDIIEVNGHNSPTDAQRENFIYYGQWNKIGTGSLQEVISKYGYSSHRFILGNTSATLDESELTGESLSLVIINNITIDVYINKRGKIKHKINFTCNGSKYNGIYLSDIQLKDQFNKVGLYNIEGQHYAVFSITGKFETTGLYYKMLAKLF